MIKQATRETLLQYTATFIASITTLGCGATISWNSPALTYLTSEESYLPTTKDQTSWIASLLMSGLVIGSFLNPVIVNKTNRKKTLIIFAFVQALSWLLLVLAKNIMVIYIARIIKGIGYGGGICATIAYISEIGDRNSRGTFLFIMKISNSLGGTITMILGASVSYQKMNIVLLTAPLIFICLFYFMPDSSYFLEMHKKRDQKKEEEEEVKMKLDPLEEEVEREQKLIEVGNLKNINLQKDLLETKDHVLKMKRDFKTNFFKTRTLNIKETNFWKLFALPNNRRAMLIIASVTCIITFSGSAAYLSFTEQIFTYEGCFVPPKIAALVYKLSGWGSSIFGVFFVERVKRRSFLLYSGMTLAISNAFVGLFFFLKENSVDVSFIEWLPVVALSIFDVAFVSGISALFFIYQGELFSVEIKGEGIACVKVWYMTLIFFVLLYFQTLLSALGYYMTFWLFALGSGLTTYVTYILVPETKGKSFDEIQILLIPSSGNVKIK